MSQDVPVINEETRFLATPENGEVSGLLTRPTDATHLLVLGHGASTNMRHATMQSIADALAQEKIATFRYNFPYSEKDFPPQGLWNICGVQLPEEVLKKIYFANALRIMPSLKTTYEDTTKRLSKT